MRAKEKKEAKAKMKKEWVTYLLCALGCIILGDALCITCDVLEMNGLVPTMCWLFPLGGFIYFFFVKFWRSGAEIDASLSKRIARMRFFLTTLIWGVVVSVVTTVIGLVISAIMELSDEKVIMIGWLVQLLSSAITTLVIFRYIVYRLHDMGWSCKVAKWQALIAILTLSGFMFPSLAAIVIVLGYIPNQVLFLILLFHGGKANGNAYSDVKSINH